MNERHVQVYKSTWKHTFLGKTDCITYLKEKPEIPEKPEKPDRVDQIKTRNPGCKNNPKPDISIIHINFKFPKLS